MASHLNVVVRKNHASFVLGGNPNHGFSFPLPDSRPDGTPLKDGATHTIYAYAIGIDADGNFNGRNPGLGGTGQAVTCSPDEATFVGQSVPSQVDSNQSFDVSITMRNSGASTWVGGSGSGSSALFNLGAQNPQDNTTWGTHRIYLPAGVSVGPGQSYSFSATLTAPDMPGGGTAAFQWRMVHDGVRWFGEYTPSVPIYVNGYGGPAPCPPIGPCYAAPQPQPQPGSGAGGATATGATATGATVTPTRATVTPTVTVRATATRANGKAAASPTPPTPSAKGTATTTTATTATAATSTTKPPPLPRANIPFAPTNPRAQKGAAGAGKGGTAPTGAAGASQAVSTSAPVGPAVANALVTVIYLHQDHLGSVSMATDAWGNVVSRQEYDPWGRVRSGSAGSSPGPVTQTKLNYTGQKLDGTGLLYYRARYYDPGLGRFVSPDSIVPGASSGVGGTGGTVGQQQNSKLTVDFHETGFLSSATEENQLTLQKGFWFQLGGEDRQKADPSGPSNPQSLNRYSYVLNNPLRYVDPTGHCLEADDCTGSSNGASQPSRASTLKPGPYAGDSIPARGPAHKTSDFTPEERAEINRIGQTTGCHTCGATDPGTKKGNFVPDHQPPNALNPNGEDQRLYPQCGQCNRDQFGEVGRTKRQQNAQGKSAGSSGSGSGIDPRGGIVAAGMIAVATGALMYAGGGGTRFEYLR